jgi:hypothetical protein
MYFVGTDGPYRTAYYCVGCYNLFITKAVAEIAGFDQDTELNGIAAVDELGVLLGMYKPKAKELLVARAYYMPAELIVNRLPFGRYYLYGAELEQHKACMREKMGLAILDEEKQ